MRRSCELAARPDESRPTDGDWVEFGGFLDARPLVRSTLRLEPPLGGEGPVAIELT
jgi:hypothetical protein